MLPRSFPSSPHEVCNIIPRMRLPTACINYCQIQHQRCLCFHHTLWYPLLSLKDKKNSWQQNLKCIWWSKITFELPHWGKTQFFVQKHQKFKSWIFEFFSNKYLSNIWIFAPKIMSIWILGSGLDFAILGAKIQIAIFFPCKNTWNALKNWVSYPWWTMKDFLHFCPLCIVKFKKLHRWLTPTQTILSPF